VLTDLNSINPKSMGSTGRIDPRVTLPPKPDAIMRNVGTMKKSMSAIWPMAHALGVLVPSE